MSRASERHVLRELARIAGRLTGFRKDAVSEEALARFLSQERRKGHQGGDLLAGLRAGDRAAAERLVSEVMVAETFFFRHPEHFELLLRDILPELLDRAEPPRLWSAGCASGEEAYSLAACLLAAAGPERARRALVLGTDLSASRLELARRAHYRGWSVRDAGPMVVPVLDPRGPGIRVREQVRALARFEVHNLLDAPPDPGLFDVIFCRNVLVYLDSEPARTVRDNLAFALRPGGYLFLGPLEGDEPGPWMRPLPGRPDVLRRAEEPRYPTPRPPTPRPLTPRPLTPRPSRPSHPAARAMPAPPPAPAPDSTLRPPEIEAHCAALELVEQGDLGQARAALRALRGRVPRYLPGMVDLALVDARLGHGAEAVRTMREALEMASGLSEGELVQGPEPLPVEYYRAVAQVFLNQRRGYQ